MRAPPAATRACAHAVSCSQRRQRVGQVRLQHDARLEVAQARVFEDAGEDRDREVEVAVLLHVEVDERPVGRRREIQRQQPLDDLVDHFVERPHRDVARDRRHLHRDVVDIGAADEVVDAVEPAQRLILTEHGLAEQVEVELRAALADRRDRRSELLGPARRRRGARPSRAAPDARSARRATGRIGATAPPTLHRTAQVPGQEPGHERRDAAQIGCRGRQALGAHHAVDEADREGQARSGLSARRRVARRRGPRRPRRSR